MAFPLILLHNLDMPKQKDLFDTSGFSVPSRGIWLYRKTSVSDTVVKRILRQVPLSYGIDCMAYTDDPESLSAWLRLKDAVETSEGGLLIISSLNDIGRTVGGVADEVSWIVEKGLEVIVMDLPSTAVFEKPQINGIVFRNSAEVWDSIMGQVQAVNGKRQRFPEGWDSLYRDWKAGKMKTKEFSSAAGLHVATLYTKIREYESMHEGTVTILPLREKSTGMYEYF